MRQIHILFLAVFLIAITGCDSRKVIYKEHESFGEDFYWYKKDVKTFVVDVKENAHPLELSLTFRYASSYFYDKVLIQIVETDPSGNSVRRDVELKIRDEKGEFIGDKGFDIIDLEYVLDGKKQFPVFGKYTYQISQVMPDIDPLEFAMDVGLIVREPLTN